MFLTHAPEFRIVQNQVGKLRALLHKVDLRQPLYPVVEIVDADQFGKDHARIVEAERLVEVTG